MTVPPLPDQPVVRLRIIYNDFSGNTLGNRLYFSYTGGPPTSADLNSLATSIRAAWITNCAPMQHSLVGVAAFDLLDIASYSGNSGTNSVGTDGSRSGTVLPVQCAFNLKFDIARRYRGGKPKVFLPWGVDGDLVNPATWVSTFGADAQSAFEAFITAVTGLSEPSIAIKNHVNVSYYQGFKNIANSSGRERAVPQYRASALTDIVTSYAYDPTIGSQRRRRTSTTP